jgi:hypothetical protein
MISGPSAKAAVFVGSVQNVEMILELKDLEISIAEKS